MIGKNPPYVAYRSFDAFIGELAASGVPDQLDLSVFASFSAAVRAQLLPALRYLGLLTDGQNSTPELRKLVEARGTSRYAEVLNQLLDQSYRLPDDLDLAVATPSKFADAFEGLGCSGPTLRRAQIFFLKAARSAGRDIGPRLEFGRRSPPLSATTPRQSSPRRSRSKEAAEDRAYRRDLLMKYPDFDPNWPDGTRRVWLEGFERLFQNDR